MPWIINKGDNIFPILLKLSNLSNVKYLTGYIGYFFEAKSTIEVNGASKTIDLNLPCKPSSIATPHLMTHHIK